MIGCRLTEWGFKPQESSFHSETQGSQMRPPAILKTRFIQIYIENIEQRV